MLSAHQGADLVYSDQRTVRPDGLIHMAALGRTAFRHQEPQPGSDVWIVDVDAERIASPGKAVTQRVAVHTQATEPLSCWNERRGADWTAAEVAVTVDDRASTPWLRAVSRSRAKSRSLAACR